MARMVPVISPRAEDTMDRVTVLILTWNRPIFLWACLDSLYRYTRRPARFILVDNHSDDPLVRSVIRGFERRRMFDSVEWSNSNRPDRSLEMIRKYRELLGEHFVYLEGDTVVFDTDPCWLSRFCTLIEADPKLALLGSYLDTRDFINPDFARAVDPHLDAQQFDGLIKAHSPERTLNSTYSESIIEPFNPPGRLLMIRTSIIDSISEFRDDLLYQHVKAAGLHAGIATSVRHRHLSLLNFFDYPEYDMIRRDRWFYDGNGISH
jgi:glycosyltransferase involved in cell wall biosynthesis